MNVCVSAVWNDNSQWLSSFSSFFFLRSANIYKMLESCLLYPLSFLRAFCHPVNAHKFLCLLRSWALTTWENPKNMLKSEIRTCLSVKSKTSQARRLQGVWEMQELGILPVYIQVHIFGTLILKGVIEWIPVLWLTLHSKLFLEGKALLKNSLWRHVLAVE